MRPVVVIVTLRRRLIRKAEDGNVDAMMEYCSTYPDIELVRADKGERRRVLRYLRTAAKKGCADAWCNYLLEAWKLPSERDHLDCAKVCRTPRTPVGRGLRPRRVRSFRQDWEGKLDMAYYIGETTKMAVKYEGKNAFAWNVETRGFDLPVSDVSPKSRMTQHQLCFR